MQTNPSISDNDSETVSPILDNRLGSMKKLILFNNIRLRLLEQLCFLDIKEESHSYFANELSKFFQHRAIVESEHSRGLENILNCFQLRHSETSSKGSKLLPSQTPYSCWNLLIAETQSLSIDYNTLSEIYNVEVILKLQKVLQIYKKYYDLVAETHEEILRILRNFYTTITTYTIYQKNDKCSSDKLETLKARNIYKHFTETSNVDMHKNMLRDLKDIIHSMDLGFCLMVSKAILAHVNSEQKQFQKKLSFLIEENIPTRSEKAVDSPIVKNKFLGQNHESVLIQKDKFNKGKDDEPTVGIESLLHLEFELQAQSLKLKEEKIRKNLEVIYGILDTLEMNTATLLGHEPKTVYDINPQLEVKPKIAQAKSLSNSSLSAVIKQISLKSHSNSSVLESKAKTIPNPCQIRPRLFGGSLEDYLKITNEQIPLIMRSCIRVISTYGLRSQGIFRVSGSQIEIMNFRESFERGEDPLAGASDASDMNSVAGVLKLYLRELQEPLFPSKYFDFFISLMQKESEQEVVGELKNFFKTISKPIVIVIRFLFSFLNHLSEFASENMMDAFNLAISFGPTLMPTPEDRKQVQYQTQLNELIKIIIVHHQEVFPKDLGGPRYQKQKAENYLNSSSNNAAE